MGLIKAFVLLWTVTPTTSYRVTPHRWVASRYADTRKDEGGTPACWKRIPDADFDRMYDRRCASRTLPCGTLVILSGPAGPSHCWVLDRGPYGKDDQGDWRGHLDLSPVPAGEVGIWSPVDGPGRVKVKAWVVRRPYPRWRFSSSWSRVLKSTPPFASNP